MEFRIQFDREEDGRWIADIPELPGVLATVPGNGEEEDEEAKAAVEALALRVLADRIEETKQTIPAVTFA